MTKPALLMIGSYPNWDMQALERDYEVLRLWEQADKDGFVAQHAARITAIGTRGDLGASRALMDKLPNLKIIACNGVGTDAIDLAAAKARGIAVTNTPDVLNEEVADLTLALMLGIARQIGKGDAFVRSGKWANEGWPLLTRMSGKRLGLLGLGRIGLAIAKRAEAFGMPIAYHTRTKREGSAYTYYPSLVELAQNSDFLVAILPGGAGTQNIVNADVLKALGPKGFFINVARGTVADEEALLQALANKTIAGAALDVFWNEPKINERFFKLENALLHPHGGSATVETRQAMGKLVQDNLAAHFAGKPLLTPVG
ncbi:2-hydroxyacid dehydrogenase [Aestuariivirga litoralis]|uniref:2-hydroxyacid dehydrogenase n=1 Tax=Aestuariivirga litoralis TaxID=2650924 RepID=UPI0018C699AC|nr:2-hydroxyacid dehydrogenase [Aestuariivirga litoralis]MBG1232523.1 2-hydroxyacid dehydrogenase [Aestuariivirga litoralis]